MNLYWPLRIDRLCPGTSQWNKIGDQTFLVIYYEDNLLFDYRKHQVSIFYWHCSKWSQKVYMKGHHFSITCAEIICGMQPLYSAVGNIIWAHDAFLFDCIVVLEILTKSKVKKLKTPITSMQNQNYRRTYRTYVEGPKSTFKALLNSTTQRSGKVENYCQFSILFNAHFKPHCLYSVCGLYFSYMFHRLLEVFVYFLTLHFLHTAISHLRTSFLEAGFHQLQTMELMMCSWY